VGVDEAGSELFDRFLFLSELALEDRRKPVNLLDEVRELGRGEMGELIAARLSGQVKSEKEQNFHLGNKSFGRSDTDFQASPSVNDLVGGPGDG